MEFITSYSTPSEMADAIRGVYGKKIEKDYKIFYLGNVILGIGDLDQIKKNVECKTSSWEQLSDTVFLAYFEE
jgi:hypothetical protein